jgi:Beta-ketoacyl synthase, N-terminal domain
MTSLNAHVDGVALWAPELPGWAHARAAFLGHASAARSPHRIPAPEALPLAERRRAPETVALAIAAGDEAVRASGQPASGLLAVFTSVYGDLQIIDHLCSTLVRTPTLISPTRFLHSVHNAPAGVWSMLACNAHAHSAVSGATHSFAAGLLEAVVLCEAEQQPVLLVGYDTAATGALAHTANSRGALAVALVLNPRPSAGTQARLGWTLSQGRVAPERSRSEAARLLAANGMAPALPLFEALAREAPETIALPVSDHQTLHLDLEPVACSRRHRHDPLSTTEIPAR